MYTEFKFSPAQISQQAADTAKALAAAKPGVNPAQFAAATIAERLRTKPASYLQYGPYWWAAKAALRSLGEDFGPNDDAGIRAEYGDGLPVYGAMVAAEQFRAYYGANFLAGSDRFDLDADGEDSYVLFDSDMEVRKLGGAHPLRVAADLDGVELEPDAVLDSATATPILDATLTPFAVKFAYGSAVWTAHVYAADVDGADAKVKGLESSGRMGRAIDFGKNAGDSVLDSSDYETPLFIDTAKRTVSEMAVSGQLAHS